MKTMFRPGDLCSVGITNPEWDRNNLIEIKTDNFADKIKAMLSTSIDCGNCSAEEISKKLHISKRTLFRRLKKNNMTYQGLRDERRRQIYLELREDILNLDILAEKLGYSDARAYRRAIKKIKIEVGTICP